MCRRKTFPSFVGLLLCFLQISAANNQKPCEPSSCGKITNISYPFRLKNDPQGCGDARYELACENNTTVLSLYYGRYHVQAINYKNYTIRLVDPAIQPNDCSSIPRYFLSPYNFTDLESDLESDPYQCTGNDISFFDLLFKPVIYLNCSNPVRDDPRYVDTIPCVNWHSKGHFYAIFGDLSPVDLKVGCHVKLVAATSSSCNNTGGYYCHEPDNETYSYAEIHRMLVYGFDVSWVRRACEDFCGNHTATSMKPARILHATRLITVLLHWDFMSDARINQRYAYLWKIMSLALLEVYPFGWLFYWSSTSHMLKLS